MTQQDEPGRTVLIVEDNERNRRLLDDLLVAGGYVPVHSSDGPEALETVRTTVPDIVLLDIGLPGMDGFEVLRRMREIEDLSEVPVIAVTSYVSASEQARMSDAGFEGFIAKPIDIDQFYTTLETALRGKTGGVAP
jgi:CheY-like chemotaxis protein